MVSSTAFAVILTFKSYPKIVICSVADNMSTVGSGDSHWLKMAAYRLPHVSKSI